MKNDNSLLKRIISGIVLAPIVLGAVYTGNTLYEFLIIIACILMSLEWAKIINKSTKARVQEGVYYTLWWYAFGFVYIFTPCACFIYLRGLPEGRELMYWLLLSVWATDIGAYFTGIALKGPKIAPSISPKKTWSGLIGGMLLAAITGYIYSKFWLHPKYNLALVSIIIAIISQIGDFFESAIKRHFKIKDSGNLIPGHGGILDRVDGLITASIFITLLETYGRL